MTGPRVLYGRANLTWTHEHAPPDRIRVGAQGAPGCGVCQSQAPGAVLKNALAPGVCACGRACHGRQDATLVCGWHLFLFIIVQPSTRKQAVFMGVGVGAPRRAPPDRVWGAPPRPDGRRCGASLHPGVARGAHTGNWAEGRPAAAAWCLLAVAGSSQVPVQAELGSGWRRRQLSSAPLRQWGSPDRVQLKDAKVQALHCIPAG